jgi:rubrerythrin
MRAKRLYLNKDMGTIDPQIGKGTTPRGLVADNFAHAVEAAIDDTRDKWATLEEQLAATYGDQQGARVACVITHDRPLNACP